MRRKKQKEDIAQKLGVSHRAFGVLCEAMVILGIVKRHKAEGRSDIRFDVSDFDALETAMNRLVADR